MLVDGDREGFGVGAEVVGDKVVGGVGLKDGKFVGGTGD